MPEAAIDPGKLVIDLDHYPGIGHKIIIFGVDEVRWVFYCTARIESGLFRVINQKLNVEYQFGNLKRLEFNIEAVFPGQDGREYLAWVGFKPDMKHYYSLAYLPESIGWKGPWAALELSEIRNGVHNILAWEKLIEIAGLLQFKNDFFKKKVREHDGKFFFRFLAGDTESGSVAFPKNMLPSTSAHRDRAKVDVFNPF